MSTRLLAGSVALFYAMRFDAIPAIRSNWQSKTPPFLLRSGLGPRIRLRKVNIRAAIELGGGPTIQSPGHVDGFVVVTLEVSGSQTQIAALMVRETISSAI